MTTQTAAQFLGITKFPFIFKNDDGRVIYHECDNGHWCKYTYDSDGNTVYFIDSDGWWCKSEYDYDGNIVYHETCTGVSLDFRDESLLDFRDESLDINMKEVLETQENPEHLPETGKNNTAQPTIAKQLGVNEFPFMIYDKNGRIIYLEYADGICWKNEYIATGKKVTFTKGDGTVEIYEHDLDGNEISYSNSNGFWTKHEYNSDGDLIYYETCLFLGRVTIAQFSYAWQ